MTPDEILISNAETEAEPPEPWLPVEKQKALAELGFASADTNALGTLFAYEDDGDSVMIYSVDGIPRNAQSITFSDQPWWDEWKKESE